MTALGDVEYSFDVAYWSGVNTLDVPHGKDVTGYVRYAQTAEMNASAPVAVRGYSGHGAMTLHERVEPDCVTLGNVEYWECVRYFLDEGGVTETTLEDTVLAKTRHTEGEPVREKVTAATCTADGAAATEVTAADVTVKAPGHSWAENYESDKSGHWHKCAVCGADSEAEKHVSDGAATASKAETCKVCG